MSDSLADEFEELVTIPAWYATLGFERWVTDNRDRILAALRLADEHGTVRRAENARIARIVREPTFKQASAIGGIDDNDDGLGSAKSASAGESACRTILALANEAGERERQG